MWGLGEPLVSHHMYAASAHPNSHPTCPYSYPTRPSPSHVARKRLPKYRKGAIRSRQSPHI
jgi:hypothetical protein